MLYTKITANTTDEEIWKPVETARNELQTRLDMLHGTALVYVAQQVYNAEVLADCQITYRDICLSRPQNRQKYLIELLFRNPQDTSSGRYNDSKRMVNDTLREWAREALLDLQYEDTEYHDEDQG